MTDLSAVRLIPELARPYAKVIEALPPHIPGCFRDQAQIAACYLQALDTGQPLSTSTGQLLADEVRTFGDQLMETGFVLSGLGYNCQVERDGGLVWREEGGSAYPHWVHERRRSYVPLSQAQEEVVRGYVLKYFEEWGIHHRGRHGDYYNFDERRGAHVQKDDVIRGEHKAYIEGEEVLETEAVLSSWDELTRRNLHPQQMKLSEGRVVMYWGGLSDEDASVVIRIFYDCGIQIRGLAQDPLVICKEDGRLKIEARMSHDGSLGSSAYNFTWKATQYDPGEFLRQWLQVAFVYGKRPDNPYGLSFIIASIPEGETYDEFRQEVAALKMGLSLVFTSLKHPFLLLWDDPPNWVVA